MLLQRQADIFRYLKIAVNENSITSTWKTAPERLLLIIYDCSGDQRKVVAV